MPIRNATIGLATTLTGVSVPTAIISLSQASRTRFVGILPGANLGLQKVKMVEETFGDLCVFRN
jgi:hypothetical protein